MGEKGRKGKYDTHVKPYLEEIEEWINEMNEGQICERLGIGVSTFAEYKTKYPELKEALKKGKQKLVKELRGALIQKALGYEYTESKITTEKTVLPDDVMEMLKKAGIPIEKILPEKVKTEVAKKKVPPDVAAINLALKNYDRNNWANDPQLLELRKQEIEIQRQRAENSVW